MEWTRRTEGRAESSRRAEAPVIESCVVRSIALLAMTARRGHTAETVWNDSIHLFHVILIVNHRIAAAAAAAITYIGRPPCFARVLFWLANSSNLRDGSAAPVKSISVLRSIGLPQKFSQTFRPTYLIFTGAASKRAFWRSGFEMKQYIGQLKQTVHNGPLIFPNFV